MNKKKIFIVLTAVASAYLIGLYIYLSMAPSSKHHCPITALHEQPITLDDPTDPSHSYTTINDASCLNETRVYAIVPVATVDDIQQAL